MREVTASAPGKVNLILRVGEPSSDGYHPLTTVFEAVNLREVVTVRTAKSAGIRVSNTAYHVDGAVDIETTRVLNELDAMDHLAVKAAKVLQRLAMTGPWGRDAAGLDIHVAKYIPMAGGMAGGSADAAATLLACNELWGLGLSTEQLLAVGRQLGADVPACILGGLTLGTGRGDLLTPIPAAGATRHHWVFITSTQGLSTPEVFRALDAQRADSSWEVLPEVAVEDFVRLAVDAHAVAPELINDLEEVAFSVRPELRAVKEAVVEAGALAAIISGSGPTIAALVADENAGHTLADRIMQKGLRGVGQCIVTSGPAGAARIEQTQQR